LNWKKWSNCFRSYKCCLFIPVDLSTIIYYMSLINEELLLSASTRDALRWSPRALIIFNYWFFFFWYDLISNILPRMIAKSNYIQRTKMCTKTTHWNARGLVFTSSQTSYREPWNTFMIIYIIDSVLVGYISVLKLSSFPLSFFPSFYHWN
jgi:hypothetical protein